MSDLISRQAALEAILNCSDIFVNNKPVMIDKVDVQEALMEVPTAEPKKGNWTTEEVAELLFNLFGDDCACNFNDIDEWLPERCKYTEIADECPNPKEKHGCWMQFLLQGGAGMRGEEDGK